MPTWTVAKCIRAGGTGGKRTSHKEGLMGTVVFFLVMALIVLLIRAAYAWLDH